MSVAAQKLTERRRAAPDVRRKQLIDATMACIARKGISATTLADVACEAGLSQGIVNLHFKSKSNLLNETLASLADHYAEAREKDLARCGPGARERLASILEADFKPAVFNRRKIAVWYAFLGEAGARPTYRRICQARDDDYDTTLLSAVTELLKESKRSTDAAELIAEALSAMTDGLWMNYLIAPEQWGRERARSVVFAYLASVFPESFSELT